MYFCHFGPHPRGDYFWSQPAPFDDFATDDVGELEALVAGVTQTTQSTLLLKKRKETEDCHLDGGEEEKETR